jgi:hypothetical protein
MTSWTEEFLETGMLVVQDALAPDFCERIVAERLPDIGVHESDAATWPDGWHSLPATTAFPIEVVAPAAAEALFEIVGPSEHLKFYDVPDNLIINFPNLKRVTPPGSAPTGTVSDCRLTRRRSTAVVPATAR